MFVYKILKFVYIFKKFFCLNPIALELKNSIEYF